MYEDFTLMYGKRHVNKRGLYGNVRVDYVNARGVYVNVQGVYIKIQESLYTF